jgi:hypothetical protein
MGGRRWGLTEGDRARTQASKRGRSVLLATGARYRWVDQASHRVIETHGLVGGERAASA